MPSFTSLFTTCLIAMMALSSISSIEAVPLADPNVPTFSAYPLSNLKGRSKFFSQYRCQNHAMEQVGSVHYHTGPVAKIEFFSKKNCQGHVTHSMTSETVKQMGGPYQTRSVRITKL